MQFFWKRQLSVMNKIERYLDQVDICRDRFVSCMRHLITDQVNMNADDDLVDNVHLAEAAADDLRREIERQMYERALIPESRGDVLGLIESFDQIPGDFESLCYQISLQRIRIPEAMQETALKLVDVNVEAYGLMSSALRDLFFNRPVLELIKQVDEKESESDRIERKMIKALFEIDMDKSDRILVKEVIVNIGDISDLALSTADRLTVAVAKRRI